ncbi:hypothetical protein Ancab_010203 [Ancistrocladus abbreviatus]
MAQWSAENATKAYLRTLKMGKGAKEPDVSEFISAIAAGNNAQLMVVASAGTAATSDIIQALVAAAQQTGGHVICILRCLKDVQACKQVHCLIANDRHVEFVIGDAERLIKDYGKADFVVVDCKLDHHERIVGAVKGGKNLGGSAIILGYNAFHGGSWEWSGLKTQLLPIGDGLSVTRIPAAATSEVKGCYGSLGRKSNWVVKVDKFTGEEHVFRVRSHAAR